MLEWRQFGVKIGKIEISKRNNKPIEYYNKGSEIQFEKSEKKKVEWEESYKTHKTLTYLIVVMKNC